VEIPEGKDNSPEKESQLKLTEMKESTIGNRGKNGELSLKEFRQLTPTER
jgi:hypothetical protein